MLLVNIGWASENPASLFAVKMAEFWECASIRRVRSRAKKPRQVTIAPINMSSRLGTRNRGAGQSEYFSMPNDNTPLLFGSSLPVIDDIMVTCGSISPVHSGCTSQQKLDTNI